MYISIVLVEWVKLAAVKEMQVSYVLETLQIFVLGNTFTLSSYPEPPIKMVLVKR